MSRFKGIANRVAIAATAAVMAACASIGRPEGGPKDETPPVFVRSNPAPGTLNFKGNHLTLHFDENIKLEDVLNKVIVSPVQRQPPTVVGNGHRISVTFRDTMVDNATYTIDFSDAIRDLNEGNILDGFAFDFSTGPTRDSLVIAGMVLEARTLEPAQGMTVGVYRNLSDTAITSLPFDRISKTNQYGQFIIRNLPEGDYKLFAVNDLNRDYSWNRTEDIAFYPGIVTPKVENIEVTDTLRAFDGGDSIVSRGGVHYYPNDLLLTWFNENYKAQYLVNNNRLDSTRVELVFNAPSDTLPTLTLLNTHAAGRNLDEVALLNHSRARDSVTYWLTDPEIIHTDTLMLAARYLRTDSLDQLSWTNDTLKIINKSRPAARPEKKKKDKHSEEDSDSVKPIPTVFMQFTPDQRSTRDIHKPLTFMASQPIDTILSKGIRLEVLIDTTWTSLGYQPLVRDSVNRLLQYSLHYDWEPSTKYRFTADSASIYGIYGLWNNKTTTEFTTKALEDYSSVTFTLTNTPDSIPMVVELLSSSDKPIAVAEAIDGVATFEYLDPSTYYARAYADRNANGKWDTGNVANHIQPEDVYYYPKKLNVKKNWDISQSWNLDELAVDAQKPYAIKKNKPKTKEPDQQYEEDEEEEDNPFGQPGAFGNGYNNSYNNDRNLNRPGQLNRPGMGNNRF